MEQLNQPKCCDICKNKDAAVFSTSTLYDGEDSKFCYCEGCYIEGRDKIKEHMKKKYGDYEKKVKGRCEIITETENCICGEKIPKVFMFMGAPQSLCIDCHRENLEILREIS